MILIAGLGNPGERYEFNRHNVGFLTLNALAERLGAEDSWKKQDIYFDSELLQAALDLQPALLVKPGMFVNETGKSLGKIMDDREIDSDALWVIHDDTEFPLGEVRVKFAGTSGGHNGIKSIDEAVGANYWRIRVGVGRPENREHDLADYVLSDFLPEERQLLEGVIDQTVSYLVKSLEEGQINATTFKYAKEEQ